MKINEKIENYILNKSNKLKINSNDISNGDVFLALKGTSLLAEIPTSKQFL